MSSLPTSHSSHHLQAGHHTINRRGSFDIPSQRSKSTPPLLGTPLNGGSSPSYAQQPGYQNGAYGSGQGFSHQQRQPFHGTNGWNPGFSPYQYQQQQQQQAMNAHHFYQQQQQQLAAWANAYQQVRLLLQILRSAHSAYSPPCR